MAEERHLWAWQVFDVDGDWGIIAASINGEITPLVTQRRSSAVFSYRYAIRHHERTGLPIRLARFTVEEVEREIPDNLMPPAAAGS